jgi:hypothetical protein
LGIVKQHGGFLDIYSELGKGSTFRVYLAASEGAAEPLHHVDDAPVRGGTETILVAEDHEGMREMAREILERLGYHLPLLKTEKRPSSNSQLIEMTFRWCYSM